MNVLDFYNKIPIWIKEPKEKWNHITLLAYFCYKYEKKYDVKYIPNKWKNGVGRSKESRDFGTLYKKFMKNLDGTPISLDKNITRAFSINKVYNYINWMFDYKFRQNGKVITSPGLFLNNNMLNEFEVMYNKHLNKKNNEDKFGQLISWCKEAIPEVLEFHQLDEPKDLIMIQKYLQVNKIGEDTSESKLIKKAKEFRLI